MTSDLIDTTEMYLRTVWELEEEGIPAIRARLAERLHLSAPSVSETVARLEAEGLLGLAADRTLELTDRGRELAVSVMRKHRLAERLLVDVIGLDWEHVHAEACRWEHVISDEVEHKLVELLDAPGTCPHGNPIPGLSDDAERALTSLADASADRPVSVRVERISEKLQGDVDAMRFLSEHHIRPGLSATVEAAGDTVKLHVADGGVQVPVEYAQLVYVTPQR